MKPSSEGVVAIFLAELTSQERANCVVYVARETFQAGTRLEFPGVSIDVKGTGFVAFVDRQPLANWSHSCRYMLLDVETGDVTSFEG